MQQNRRSCTVSRPCTIGRYLSPVRMWWWSQSARVSVARPSRSVGFVMPLDGLAPGVYGHLFKVMR